MPPSARLVNEGPRPSTPAAFGRPSMEANAVAAPLIGAARRISAGKQTRSLKPIFGAGATRAGAEAFQAAKGDGRI